MNAVVKDNVLPIRSNTDELSVRDVAAESMDKAGGDIQEATSIMERWVCGDKRLFNELMTPLVREACYNALRKTVQEERRNVWTAPNYTKAGNGGRLVSTAMTLLDFRLPHNLKVLREAGKDDLIAGADWYEKQAGNMQHKARWLRAIAEKVGSKAVGEKFSAESLAKIQEAVK